MNNTRLHTPSTREGYYQYKNYTIHTARSASHEDRVKYYEMPIPIHLLLSLRDLVLFLMILVTLNSFAQTANEGVLYISPDTKFSTEADFNNKPSGGFYNDGEAFIYADFNNAGEVDFYQETGLTRFVGSDVQEISGAASSSFYNVFFNNSSTAAPFHLYGGINVYGEADFTKGIVDVDNYNGSFLFEASGLHRNTSDISHVDGFVEKYGDSDFIFPIGDKGYYRFAGVSELPSSNIYSAKYHLENSDPLYSHNARQDIISLIDDKEFWTVEPVTQEEGTLLTLSWREETTPQEIIQAPEQGNIHIVRWDTERSMWIDEGGVVDVNNKTVTTAVEKYGVFTLARVKSEHILPCDIVVYNAVTPNGDGINDYFKIDNSNSDCAENIHVEIFNRWGVKVFETNNYGLNNNYFNGYSNGRLTIDQDQKLPTGTYYYILNYQYDMGSGLQYYKKAGYLYLNGI